MKKLLILAGFLALSVIKVPDGSDLQMSLVGNAQADTIATEVGNTTFFSGESNGTATTVGNTTYYEVDGQYGQATKVGNSTYYEGNLFNGRGE
jgi:hypothetical protein